MFCTNCGESLQPAAKFCMACGKEIAKLAKDSPASASKKNKTSTSKPSTASRAKKKKKQSPDTDRSGKLIFVAIIVAPVILILLANLSSGNSSITSQPYNNSVAEIPSEPKQSDSDTTDINQESTVQESSPESALDACIENGSLAASAAGYDCPPSARTVKEALVFALAYYCDMPAQEALTESSWTVLNPFDEKRVFTIQSITATGRTLWFTVDTRNENYGEVSAESRDAELYLEDWGCPSPGPYIILKG